MVTLWKLCENCAFPQNLHTRIWGEIPVFYSVKVSTYTVKLEPKYHKQEQYSWREVSSNIMYSWKLISTSNVQDSHCLNCDTREPKFTTGFCKRKDFHWMLKNKFILTEANINGTAVSFGTPINVGQISPKYIYIYIYIYI